MLEFYLCILEAIANTQKTAFLTKFNNLVYADNKLSNEEKLFLFSEMQRLWNKKQVNSLGNLSEVSAMPVNVEGYNSNPRSKNISNK